MELMVDIETLDTAPTAVILSVGAVLFDPVDGSIHASKKIVCDVQTQLDKGRTVSAGTLAFWADQDSAIYRAQMAGVRGGVEGVHSYAVCEPLRLLAKKANGVWGNGAGFDNVILENYARMFGGPPLWPHWKNRCFRTFTSIYDPKKALRTMSAGHDALADATLQADWMHRIVCVDKLSSRF